MALIDSRDAQANAASRSNIVAAGPGSFATQPTVAGKPPLIDTTTPTNNHNSRTNHVSAGPGSAGAIGS